MKKIDFEKVFFLGRKIIIVLAAIVLSVQTTPAIVVPIKPYFDLENDAKVSGPVLLFLCGVLIFLLFCGLLGCIAKICCKEK